MAAGWLVTCKGMHACTWSLRFFFKPKTFESLDWPGQDTGLGFEAGAKALVATKETCIACESMHNYFLRHYDFFLNQKHSNPWTDQGKTLDWDLRLVPKHWSQPKKLALFANQRTKLCMPFCLLSNTKDIGTPDLVRAAHWIGIWGWCQSVGGSQKTRNAYEYMLETSSCH